LKLHWKLYKRKVEVFIEGKVGRKNLKLYWKFILKLIFLAEVTLILKWREYHFHHSHFSLPYSPSHNSFYIRRLPSQTTLFYRFTFVLRLILRTPKYTSFAKVLYLHNLIYGLYRAYNILRWAGGVNNNKIWRKKMVLQHRVSRFFKSWHDSISWKLLGYSLQNRDTIAKSWHDSGSIITHKFCNFLQWELSKAPILILTHPNRP